MPRFQPEKIFEALQRHGVDYVLIGGIAATLHGSNLRTGDVDICPSREAENLERLVKALDDIDARIRSGDVEEGLPFSIDADLLDRMELLNLITRFGDLDVVPTPSGTDGYDDLNAGATSFALDELSIPTASVEDLIRSKKAANRPKDSEHLRILRLLRDEMNR